MGVRDKLARNVASNLEPGEVVHRAFRARTLHSPVASSALGAIGGSDLARATYIVVQTDRAILLFKTSVWSTTKPKQLVARVPKGTPITLEDTGYWSALRIGDHVVHVNRRVFPDAEALAQSF